MLLATFSSYRHATYLFTLVNPVPNKMEEQLREAACIGDTEAIETLIKNGVDVNDKHKINGWTALHWAARRNHQHIIKVSRLGFYF